MFKNILFLGRKNCIHSKHISFFLKKNSKQVDLHFSSKIDEKFPKKFEIKNYEYIFSFRSFIILKKKHINKCKKFAINFQ